MVDRCETMTFRYITSLKINLRVLSIQNSKCHNVLRAVVLFGAIAAYRISCQVGYCLRSREEAPKQMIEYNRRDVINLSLLSFLRLGTALPALAQTASRANRLNGFGSSGGINWDAFLEALERTAGAKGRLNQELYVEKVAGLAKALNLADPRLVSSQPKKINALARPNRPVCRQFGA
jgi:hypothetical protein